MVSRVGLQRQGLPSLKPLPHSQCQWGLRLSKLFNQTPHFHGTLWPVLKARAHFFPLCLFEKEMIIKAGQGFLKWYPESGAP